MAIVVPAVQNQILIPIVVAMAIIYYEYVYHCLCTMKSILNTKFKNPKV